MFRKIISLIAVIIAVFAWQYNAVGDSKKVKIYISQLVEHPALDATTKGIIQGLSDAGYKDENLDLIVESAQGNVSLANQIANKLISKNPDIVVGVATVTAQSFSKYARAGKTKLIFSSVTDPVDAGLVNSVVKPGNNTSGVSNFIPLEPQIEMFLKIKPGIKKLGFLYNPGELNSISLIEKLKVICPTYGIELVTVSASKTSEVPQSAVKLSSLVDAIFVSNDNTALSAFKTIVRAANSVSIPVFVSDTDIVKDGAVAALGPNQYDLGLQTAKMIVDVLEGREIDTTPVEFPKKVDLYLNPNAAEKVGVKIPKDLFESASYLVENKK
ncbi:MAG: ABC transporter substrate-binding protein [Pseudomonadota bacterium]